MRHELKIDAPYLRAKLEGNKLFEIRFDDRGYQKGDIVMYKEHKISEVLIHTFEITYVTGFMQKDNYVVFGEKFIHTKKH